MNELITATFWGGWFLGITMIAFVLAVVSNTDYFYIVVLAGVVGITFCAKAGSIMRGESNDKR